MTIKRLKDIKDFYIHKRNKYKQGSLHYHRYNGKIEAIADLMQELNGQTYIGQGYKSRKDKTKITTN